MANLEAQGTVPLCQVLPPSLLTLCQIFCTHPSAPESALGNPAAAPGGTAAPGAPKSKLDKS